MKIAEKLYQKGFLSYPRTETNKFAPSINIKTLVENISPNSPWSDFAQRVLDGLFEGPRQGKQDDKAHPPIHPTKWGSRDQMDADEWAMYNLICRHFLACVSKDAEGLETKVTAEIELERFHANGLVVM